MEPKEVHDHQTPQKHLSRRGVGSYDATKFGEHFVLKFISDTGAIMLDLTYPNIVSLFGSHNVPGRTESRAFLGWFLENYFRLEDSEAQDAICDGVDDKGVDGIYVDTNLERIVIFQTKLFQNAKKTLGDTALKEFAGSIGQFHSKATIEHLMQTTANIELRELLKANDVPALVDKGYTVVGVFVTNVSSNGDAANYLATRSDITVFDADVLQAEWVPAGSSSPIHKKVSLSLDGHSAIEYKTTEAKAYIAPLLATELIALDGIQSTELFDWNVRKSLGKTKVNKAIADSINKQEEHKNFMLFHNGLTILAESAKLSEDKLEIDGYNVVNGCQSLTTLFENKAKLSNELRVVTRVIQLSPQSELAAKITRHSNNQNAISARDLQSNSSIQRRLQAEFSKLYDGDVFYEIKRGEDPKGASVIITNEEAARLLLAFDVQEPWACHQSYRLFDDLHSDIFGRPEVNAERILALYILHEGVQEALRSLSDQLAASYRLTKYFLLFVLRRAIAIDAAGQAFIADPGNVLMDIGAEDLHKAASAVLADLVIDFNAELEERRDNDVPFDYKRELKSPNAVKKLATEIFTNYQKGVRRGKSVVFSGELDSIRNSAVDTAE